MTKDETGFEIIEAKFAELYRLQWERIERLKTQGVVHSPDVRKEIAEAKEILCEWLWCLEAKDRASRRIEGKARLTNPHSG